MADDAMSSIDFNDAPHGDTSLIDEHDFGKGPIAGRVFSGLKIHVQPGVRRQFEKCFFVDCTIEDIPTSSEVLRFKNCQWYGDMEFARGVVFEATDIKPSSGKESSSILLKDRAHLSTEQSFVSCKITRAELAECLGVKFKNTRFEGCSFAGQYRKLDFTRASFHTSDLTGVEFKECDITNGTILNCKTNTETRFTNCDVSGLQMTRFDLLCLRDFGGLTPGQRAGMNIRHDLATLRAAFSGYMQWIHLASIIALLFPYLLFIGMKVSQKQAAPATRVVAAIASEQTGVEQPKPEAPMPLGKQLWFYAISGGATNQKADPNWFQIPLLLFAFMYNGARAFMLYTTKRLEHEEQVSELPSRFSLTFRPTTRRLFYVVKYGFALNIAVAVFHSAIFLSTDFPV